MYNIWMFQAHFSSYSLHPAAQSGALHSTQHVSSSTKLEKEDDDGKQKHIYSDLHGYSPLFTQAPALCSLA